MVKIRLSRGGKKREPFYRIVVIDSKKRRGGRNLEIVGYYNPLSLNEDRVFIKEDRVLDWYFKGARATETVYRLMKKQGIVKKITDIRRELKSGKALEDLKDQYFTATTPAMVEEPASAQQPAAPAQESTTATEESHGPVEESSE